MYNMISSFPSIEGEDSQKIGLRGETDLLKEQSKREITKLLGVNDIFSFSLSHS